MPWFWFLLVTTQSTALSPQWHDHPDNGEAPYERRDKPFEDEDDGIATSPEDEVAEDEDEDDGRAMVPEDEVAEGEDDGRGIWEQKP